MCPSVTISATSPSTGAVSIGQVLAGRVLIERHLMPREDASAQRIHQWMHDHPEGAKEVRRQNRQIVFFRIVGLDDDTETIEPGAPSVQRLARVRSRKVNSASVAEHDFERGRAHVRIDVAFDQAVEVIAEIEAAQRHQRRLAR